MELRVWVDGTQRVVCGVKLTTTCQEIVFALAHATQQAGRFTMIERWRHIERLLSPNEQPLVTLQRWGDRMHEVEFILKRNSTELAQPNQLQAQQQPQSQQSHQAPPTISKIQQQTQQSQQSQQPQLQPILNNHIQTQQSQTVLHDNSRQGSPCNSLTSNPPSQSIDNLYAHQRYNLTRRPQTALGPLTGSSSSTAAPQAYLRPLTRLPNNFRTSLSASSLPCASTNTMTAFPSMFRNAHNGYPQQIQSETQLPQAQPLQQQTQQQLSVNNAQLVEQNAKNYPYEDLYTSINKRRTSQPPIVPAKPHASQIASAANMNLPLPVNNAQMNYYHQNQSPYSNQLYQNNLRSHYPPGYLDYLEAMARNQNHIVTNPQNSFVHNNMLQRPFEAKHPYRNSASSVSKLGHDMLKVIEEQKRVLMNQKTELDRLDNDHDYRLISRIENEIQQLEELWKENQAQISKLESHDFEKELVELKNEQTKIESDIKEQNDKLSRFENEISMCKNKIDQLENELASVGSDEYENIETLAESTNKLSKQCYDRNDEFKTIHLDIHSNGSSNMKDSKSSEDEDYEDDSGGDASDDMNPPPSTNVDKRGLINGIRSLKIDKSGNFSRKSESYRSSAENLATVNCKEKAAITDTKQIKSIRGIACADTNGRFPDDNTANKNSQYECLMTL